MKNRFAAVLIVSALAALPAFAQISVGVLPNTLNSSDANFPTPQTDVSLENPATGSGTIDSVTFAWNATCSGVARIKFFRRNGNTLTLIDQRGPFDTFAGGRVTQVVNLSPPVNVQSGDLIAITRLANCGNALAESGTGTQGYVVLSGDASSGTIAAGNTFHDKLGLIGTGGTAGNVVAGTLAVVGSTAGSFGANFKTSVQMFNPSNTSTLAGNLIFHHAGTQGALTDPSKAFSIGPGEILTFPDIVANMGQGGVGSMDITVAAGAQLPLVVSRIYNDAGPTAGTAGFFEDVVPPSSGAGSRVLTFGTVGFLLTPIEPARTRLNIGVRSLSQGVTFQARLEDNAGNVLAGANKTYVQDFFEQVDSTTFFGVPIGANQKIRITVSNGSAIVYGATTDNVTNDPSVQFATAIPVP